MKALYILFACQILVVTAQQLPNYYQQFYLNNGLGNWWDLAKLNYFNKLNGNINYKGSYNAHLPALTNNDAHVYYGHNNLMSGLNILKSAEPVHSHSRPTLQDLARSLILLQSPGNQYVTSIPPFQVPGYGYSRMGNKLITKSLEKKMNYGVHYADKVNANNLNLQEDLTRSMNPPKINEKDTVLLSGGNNKKINIKNMNSRVFMQQNINSEPYQGMLRNQPNDYVKKHEKSMKTNIFMNLSKAEGKDSKNDVNKININSVGLAPTKQLPFKMELNKSIAPLKNETALPRLTVLEENQTLSGQNKSINKSEPDYIENSKISMQDNRNDNQIMDNGNLMKVKSAVSTKTMPPMTFKANVPQLNALSDVKPVITAIPNNATTAESRSFINHPSNIVAAVQSNFPPFYSILPEYPLYPFVVPPPNDAIFYPETPNNDNPLDIDCKYANDVTRSLANNLNIRDIVKENDNLKLLFKILRIFILREGIINESFSYVVDKIRKALMEYENKHLLPIEREREIVENMFENELETGDLHKLFVDIREKREKDLTSAMDRLKIILVELRQILLFGGLSSQSIESVLRETLLKIVPRLTLYFIEECKIKTSNFIMSSIISALELPEP